jgi:hypothetical protein
MITIDLVAVGPTPLAEGPLFSSPDSRPVDFAVSFDTLAEEQPKGSNAGIWSIYNAQAEKHDKQLAERCIGQSRCTLNFVGFLCL